jgi:uncharacterized membrane protein (DUF2068 family)
MSQHEGVRRTIAGFKLVTGALELVGAVALLVLGQGTIRHGLDLLASKAGQDSDDRFLMNVHQRLPHLLGNKGFVAAGLLALGITKVVAAIGLLLHKPWGYYATVILLAVLLPADLYHVFAKPTPVSDAMAAANVAILVVLVLLRKPLLAHETATQPA